MDEQELRNVLDEIFDQHDLDQDGLISLSDFILMLQKIASRKYGKKRVDLDTDDIKRVLAKSDTDGNVALDKKEFYDMYKNL